MTSFVTRSDIKAYEAEMPWADRNIARSVYQMVSRARDAFGDRPAISFQLFSDPGAKAETLTWSDLMKAVTQAANLFRSLGVGEKDVVAFVLPNCTETAICLLGGAVAGIVNPINPLLEPEQISAILRETKAKVVVTLKPFPKTDVPQKVAEAVKYAPDVKTVLEVDLVRYLSGVKKFIVPLIRPKNPVTHKSNVKSLRGEMARMRADGLDFADVTEDRVAAYFHTGGTTGMPKVAQHKVSGMVYNGWLGATMLFDETDVLICPLPLFHVFAAYPILMSAISSGAHVIFPTPQGYRGDGVFDNFWKLVERWKVTFVITVPTAISALMQRPVNADISSLKLGFSASAPLPVELFKRFEAATGLKLVEGYGMTEATCAVSVNPVEGENKIGSVGLPFPYTEVRILTSEGAVGYRECAVDEVGEICVSSPGVFEGSTYTEVDKNKGLFANGRFLRTGDLGRVDADGYVFITGRAKDLIIRGGHNIDPALIEEALAGHEAVAMVGAIGQPDAHSGELPAAYVELVKGATATVDDLMAYASRHINERAAMPKYIELVDDMPKTAVGKVFKPALRRMAITRVLDATLLAAKLPVRVVDVVEDKKRGLVARLQKSAPVDDAEITRVLGDFSQPWDWAV